MDHEQLLDHQRRGPWSQAEDNMLMNLVNQNGASNWVKVSSMLQTRSAKQCRERYHQNLKPTLNHEPISAEEGELIEHLVTTIGKRWAEIARRLQNRSDNAVKNWWNGSQNRRRRHDQRSNNRRRSSYESNDSYRYSPYPSAHSGEQYSPVHHHHHHHTTRPQSPREMMEHMHQQQHNQQLRNMYFNNNGNSHAAAAAAALPSPTESWTGGNGQYPGSRPFSRWSQGESQSPPGEADMSEAGSSYAGSPTSHTSDAHLPPLAVPRDPHMYSSHPSPSGYFSREDPGHRQQLPPLRDALDRGKQLLTAPSSPGSVSMSSQQVPRSYNSYHQASPHSPSTPREHPEWMMRSNTGMHPNPDLTATLSAHDSRMKMKLGNLLS
ncbi:hypothetical protein E8E14_002823 [Neopestalotiopsis sp. 37M]|nr:hypothetical protein E8E14_002823 [Neopestalotiopsis sp. 37M]